ncbi:MAG: class I SAM-dependent methyltransferase [Candidatus Gastranaerophilales bacterium]|nr:class I SAM-dependent methyltransferase [Candidatus Gastranaerophilales bacterium]
MAVYKYKREEFMTGVKRFFTPVNILVDIGCGIRPFVDIKTKVHICIEPYKEYIDIIQGYCPTDSHYVFMNTDGITGLKTFADNSVDTVCMVDLIEHLEKDDGFELLRQADRIARQQVIVFTPLGYFPQEYHAGEKDAWGMDGIQFQQHKSGWHPEDFGNNWDFHICEKYHLKEACHMPIDKDYGCFFAIKNKIFRFIEPANVPDFVKNAASQKRIINTGTKKGLFKKNKLLGGK